MRLLEWIKTVLLRDGCRFRREHIEFLGTFGDKIKFAGPFMSEDGEKIIGSMIVVEGESVEDVRKAFASDPYNSVDVYEKVDVLPWKWAVWTG